MRRSPRPKAGEKLAGVAQLLDSDPQSMQLVGIELTNSSGKLAHLPVILADKIRRKAHHRFGQDFSIPAPVTAPLRSVNELPLDPALKPPQQVRAMGIAQ